MSDKSNNRFKWPIVGHSNIVSYLQQGLANDNTSHAYLFVGPTHIGKTTVAKNFVDSLVCQDLHEKDKGEVPCGVCECCKQIENNIHPDVYWLEREMNEKTNKRKKNISIEQVRELQNKLSLHSFLNSYKVAVIEQAQTLSLEAANSLLKTLEEPTAKTVLILLVTNTALLPRTIISRCQIINFLPVSDKELTDYLISLKTERKKAKTLAAMSFGRPGIALSYLGEPDLYADFQESVKQFVTLMKADINSRFKIISEVVNSGDIDSIKETLIVWTKVLRDLLLMKTKGENLISNLKISSDLEELANTYRIKDLVKILADINFTKRYLAANVNPKLTLENLVLNF